MNGKSILGLCLSLILGLYVVSNITISIGAPEQSERSWDVPTLREELQIKNQQRILQALNEIKRMYAYQDEILPFIQDLWEIRDDKYPALPWELIQQPIIRVSIVDILVQAQMNERIDMNLEKAHQFVRSLVDAKEKELARNAIGALSRFDDPQDVQVLMNIAKEQRDGSFRASIVALSNMCNQAAKDAFDEMEAFISDQTLKAYVIEKRASAQEYEAETHWCDSRP